MKFIIVLLNIIFLGLAASKPFLDASDSELEGRDFGKCKFKDKRCCKYQDTEYKDNDREHGSGYVYKNSHTIHVKSGQSIQRAINSASRGDRIVVEPGTYAEQLTIDKDGIQLIGRNAIIVPPSKPLRNKCSGLSGANKEAGICITGSGVKLAPIVTERRQFLSVERPVRDVSITGFKIRKFSGINIAILGARNARVTKNTVTDAGQFGVITLGSFNTLVEENVVTSTNLGFTGICMDNQSGVLAAKNVVSNQFFAICVQTNKADVQDNTVKASCFGVFVDPGVDGAKVRHNHIGPPHPNCAEFKANSGIIIDGAVKTQVLDNLVEGQDIGGEGAGISIVDDPCTGDQPGLACLSLGHKAVASDNIILRNVLRENHFDIFVNTTGRGNLIACNKCSTPEKLCKQ